ncbi:hypothetical protein A2778_01055 [Candidatus Daviesbacteria bacterium RIFCSPHIGHO2_01_FULL_40_24]|nr:MAG: hypothetical protein A2778_01055 [Candidatus Daviesbacteria bacterium RIFCSPHIGHO2_01_FULL_40_24]OGE29795.1 MAG: hypothetical protein A3C29_00685 [Candidatus Daviesbacteria bacterium RIFCSPHIGHO2_02_FULL_40_16]OGE42744.1 MAG: hypothetical protein A3A53_05505 [Candidatus Daviesbacteria bacterium RIFCSPLOWO2_01_FULL_39_23]HCH58983.1 hypothetical protein [Candidatus Zambryskibacteria bacterium]
MSFLMAQSDNRETFPVESTGCAIYDKGVEKFFENFCVFCPPIKSGEFGADSFRAPAEGRAESKPAKRSERATEAT